MTKYLITGATGHLGGLVIKHLVESEGVAPADIVAGTRRPEAAAALTATGLATARVDFDDETTLATAFAGIDRLLIISTDELATPGKRLAQHKTAVAAAAAAGVGRIFYTSLPEAETSPITFAPDHLGTETAIKETGLPYTILRNSWYMENLALSLPHALASGNWYTSEGEGRTTYIARDDIARATAAALARPVSENVIYTLTGERSYSKTEIAAIVAQLTGKPLSVVNVTDEQLTAGMIAAGLPAPIVPTFVSFDTATRLGKLGLITEDARVLAARPLVSLADFLKENIGKLSH